MNWYYADGANQVGPLDDAAFDELVRNGTITPETLVWHEGMANWQPLKEVLPPGQAAGAPPAPAAPGAGLAVCAECGNEFPQQDMIHHGNVFVCANCKPIFLQKLKEGVTVGPAGEDVPVDPAEYMQFILSRDYELPVGDCITGGWNLLKANFWLLVGATFVIFLILGGSGAVPYAGNFISLIINGPLMGGLYFLYIKTLRGDDPVFGDAFSGFGPRFLQLMLGHIVPTVLAGLCFLPAIVCLIVFLVSAGSGQNFGNFSQAALFIPFIVLGVLGLFGAVYLGVCWAFVFPLIIDRGLNFWQAMTLSMRTVNKHWFSVFGLMFLGGLIAGLGIIGCCVGVFVTASIFLGAMMCAYEVIFGSGEAAA